jgi:nitrite reductase/ring-hydroxylating ferredoxin subunit
MADCSCNTCPYVEPGPEDPGRRELVIRGGGLIAMALLGLGAAAGDAFGSPVAVVTGAATGDNERTFPLPSADGVSIDRGAQVIIVRYQNRAYAFALACPHQNTALKWLPKDGRFQCPKHESKYKPDGTFIDGRATRNMDRFAVRRDNASLVVNMSHWFESDKDPAGWASAFAQV